MNVLEKEMESVGGWEKGMDWRKHKQTQNKLEQSRESTVDFIPYHLKLFSFFFIKNTRRLSFLFIFSSL